MADASLLPVIAVDRKAASPLHRQVYNGFREAILRRELRPGQRVPSTRDLAAQLRISRLPVLNGYAQLLAEGYLESRPGAGTFVSSLLAERTAGANRPKRPTGEAAFLGAGPRPVSRRSKLLPRVETHVRRRAWGPFGLHQPAYDHFPFPLWAKLTARHSRAPLAAALHRFDPLGSETFRQAVSAYLRTSRGLRCEPDQVMIVSGSQQALDITARVLFDSGDAMWMEEPGYWLARNVFRGAGCEMMPVPVDSEGLDVAEGIRLSKRRRRNEVRAAYVTPSHQFPLGVTMGAARRLQLLNWAQSAGAWVIEDDYDSEYRYESMPVASLQGLDSNGRVIYIGTFSKVLFPALRLGYIVIPPDLVESFIAARYSMDIFPPYLNQEVLTDFMNEGHFARHIRRMRLLYSQRRTALVESLEKEFGSKLPVHGAEAGMHLVVTLPAGLNDMEIASEAEAKGLWLWPLSPTYAAGKPRSGLILGFGSTPESQMPTAVQRLQAVFSPFWRLARP